VLNKKKKIGGKTNNSEFGIHEKLECRVEANVKSKSSLEDRINETKIGIKLADKKFIMKQTF
jgi:hypothetical protein